VLSGRVQSLQLHLKAAALHAQLLHGAAHGLAGSEANMRVPKVSSREKLKRETTTI
jgi:hypothetical protein